VRVLVDGRVALLGLTMAVDDLGLGFDWPPDSSPDKAVFGAAVDDFYLTNPIARASVIMAECSVLAEGHTALTAAE